MNVITSLVLLLGGVLCLIYFRPLADFLVAFFAKQFHDAYGQYATDRGWDNKGSLEINISIARSHYL
jgi:hypothetical protein